MSNSVPAIIASLGVALILGALAMYGVANAVDNVGNLIRADSHAPMWQVNLGQANFMLVGGFGLIVLAAVLFWRR